ncbi:uncharacterized protein LOC126703484 [Quercus robur]|uniref:uncharacterized protein LOC126703484 n=1 Tax=Quercus robur TaxID=38942 RepID=UPI0021618EB2|nr:uncharacterized protein LOC126703484 [Quercus robur]
MASAEGSDSDPTHNQSTQQVPQSNTEINSPNRFFLSASENPGNILVTQPLLGMRNYQSWSRAMVLALTAKKKIGFVNGKIAKPEDDSPLIMYCETVREMWLELQRVFSQGNGPKVYNLQQEISQITQGQLSVTKYYSKFKKLWDQLIHYEPLPACTCGAMKILSIAHEKSYVMRFLMGLSESFETVRSHILMLEPFPSMSKVYALVLQEESHKGIGYGSTFTPRPDSVAMYANTRGYSGNKGGLKKERPLCTHCNMLGQTVDKCYKLHWYPPGYKHKGKPNSNANQVSYPQGQAVEVPSNASVQCPISKAQCEQLLTLFNFGTDQGANHHVASVSTSAAVSSMLSGATGVPAATGVPFTSMTSSDYAQSTFVDTISGINSLLHFSPSLKHSIFSAKVVDREVFCATDWVIDTGATDHMVHSIAYFTTITTTLNTFVNLPNGEVASVTHVGIVKISEHLILHNVLCVPSFSFNLISVSQLVKSTACCLIFFGHSCFIQDLAHWSTLGLGRESNGLYLLDKSYTSTPAIAASVHSPQVHIWHSRLGHLSNAKLASIKPSDIPSFISVENFDCNICPLAKQKRLPFNKSSHLSKSCFELIHCDLWGPFSVSTIDHCKSKFAPRAVKCVFLGYPFGVKGYKVLDLSNNKVFLSRDVVFHENSFPFASISPHIADPFLSSDVGASCSAGVVDFVTPVSIFEPSSMDFTDPPSSSH